jgi:type I restriction enzyme S subunit
VTGGRLPCIHYGELFTNYGAEITAIGSRTNNAGLGVRSAAFDVLMPTSDVTPRGLAKASAVRDTGVVLGGDILIIRSDKQSLHGPFLAYAIRHDASQVLQLVRGSTVFHIYAGDMKNFILAAPTAQEQRAICDVLNDSQMEIDQLEQRLTKAKFVKQGMMQELLTGRTRLHVAEAAS